MIADLNEQERALLHRVRVHADELARLIQDANNAGFTIQFNVNAAIGACDVFNVFKMVPVDMRAGAN